ncbi:MAG: hypothetical protein WCX31_12640 [Salinivirgaceae bacterium]
MDNYLTHLIADINQIMGQLPEPPSEIWDSVDINNPGEIEDISYIEQYTNGQEQELQYIVRIKKEALPPPHRLTDEQISRLLPVLHDLLDYYHFEPAYPDELSDRLKYQLFYDNWDSEHVKVTYGVVGIEFCDFDDTNCPIPGQCNTCERMRLEYENGPKVDPDTTVSVDDLLPTPKEIEKFMAMQKAREAHEIIEKIKPNNQNIIGIFNYCDRWCENCSFTSRCTNYQFEEELGLHDVKYDPEELFESVQNILSGTLSVLKAKAKSLDIDIDLEQFEDFDTDEPNETEEHPLVVQADIYFNKVSKWFDDNSDYLSDIASSLWNSSQRKFKELNHQLDAIDWYRSMIPVKLNRALQQNSNFMDDVDDYDRNATGKLVHQCLQKSMDSFSFLLGKLAKKEDEILSFLAMLSQIKAGLELELPNAKNTVRPGLDEV